MAELKLKKGIIVDTFLALKSIEKGKMSEMRALRALLKQLEDTIIPNVRLEQEELVKKLDIELDENGSFNFDALSDEAQEAWVDLGNEQVPIPETTVGQFSKIETLIENYDGVIGSTEAILLDSLLDGIKEDN